MPLDVWAATLPIAPPTLQPAPPPPLGSGNVLTTFQLVSPNTGPAEFSLAVPLKKGLSSGALSTSVANSQATVKRGWNDNSDKHVIIDGIANLTANIPLTVQVLDAPGAGGTILTSGNIAANTSLQAAGQNIISLGVNGSVDLSSLLGSPVRTWRSGPWAVECHYEKVVTVGTSAIYTAFHVRLYKSGRIWMRAVVENGWVELPNTDKAYTATITIGGVNVYGPLAITHFHNTGYVADGWIGGDPQVTPIHNITDLRAAKLVPNYFTDVPPSVALDALTQSYTPFGHGDINADMTNTGPQNQIGLLPMWDALYVTSGADSRAFNSVIANAKAINSYPIIWRGSADSNLPCRPSVYPNYTFFGPNQGGGLPPGAGTLVWDPAHHGSAGYLAYILTGDYFHLETMQFQSASGYLSVTCTDNYPGAPQGVNSGTNRSLFAVAVRAPAWIDRTIGQYCAIAPSDSVLTDYSALLTTQAANAVAVTQLTGVNQLGIIYEYDLFNSGGPSISMFMHWFMVQVFGAISDIEPLSNMTNWNAARDWLYKIPVNMLGDGTGGAFCYSQAAAYFDYNFGNTSPITSITDTHWPPNWNTVWSQTVNDTSDNPAPGFPLACGNTLLGNSGSSPASGATSFWANLQPAAALAVDHGASGSAAGYTRWLGASNYLTYRNAASPDDFASFPNFGIQPRDALTALLSTMAASSWKAAGTNTLSAVAYGNNAGDDATLAAAIHQNTGPSAIMNAWGSAVLDTAHERLLIANGGHGDYHGNEWYAFDFKTLTWANLSKPSDPSTVNQTTWLLSDGTPAIPHNYDSVCWDASRGKVLFLGAGQWSPFSGDTRTAWYVDPTTMVRGTTAGIGGTNSWAQIASQPFGNTQEMAHYDSVSGHVWAWSTEEIGASQFGIAEYNPVSNTWTVHGTQVAGGASQNQSGALQPGLRALATGSGQTYWYSIAGGTVGNLTIQTTTGDKTVENAANPGIVWHPPTGKFVGWAGGTTLYTLDPATWIWAAHAMTATGADIPTAMQTTGTFGRFQYDATHDCFLAVNDITQSVFFGKF